MHALPGGVVLLPVVRSSFHHWQVHLVPGLLLPLPDPHHCEYVPGSGRLGGFHDAPHNSAGLSER